MAPADLPELADALPSVAAAHRRLSAALADPDPAGRRAGALTAVALLLEAAGGPDVGNGVRTWIAVHCATLTLTTPPQGRADEQATALARTVFAGAHRDQRTALARAGLGAGTGTDAGTDSGAMDPATRVDGPRAARAAYAQQVLASRAGAVLAALDALTAARAGSTAGTVAVGLRTAGPSSLATRGDGR